MFEKFDNSFPHLHLVFTNLIDSRRTLDPVFLTLKCEIAIPCMAKSIILNNLLCILVLKTFDLNKTIV